MRSGLRFLAVAVSAAAVPVLSPSPIAADAECCMCVTGDKQQAFREAAAVFVGTVVAAGEEGVGEVRFELEAVWKIERPQESPLTVVSDESGCGYHFVVGESYLVFASRWKDGAPLSVSNCSIVLNFWQDSELRDELPPPEWQSKRYFSLIKGERLDS